MGFDGRYEWYRSPQATGRRMIRFILKNDNLLQSETFDAKIIPVDGYPTPMIFRNQKLKAGKSLIFDLDSIGWQWNNGDSFAILGRKDKIKQQWPLKLHVYPPGECPECHGMMKCTKCNGRGFVYLINKSTEQCDRCFGTGECQTCYIPNRLRSLTPPGQNPGPSMAKNRQIEALRNEIIDLQSKISNTEWDIKMWQLKDMDRRNPSIYMSQQQLLHTYKIKMIELQNRLTQLENI